MKYKVVSPLGVVIGGSVRRLCIRRSAHSCPNIRQHTQVDWTIFRGTDEKGNEKAYQGR